MSVQAYHSVRVGVGDMITRYADVHRYFECSLSGGKEHYVSDTLTDEVELLVFNCPLCISLPQGDRCFPFVLVRSGSDLAIRCGDRPSWPMSGSGVDDLTLDGSILRYVESGRGVQHHGLIHVHFFIREGVIVDCGDGGHPWKID